MPKSKLQEIGEQAAHLIFSALFAYLIGPLTLPFILIREYSKWRWLPFPIKGQWPPGKPFEWLPEFGFDTTLVTSMKNVEDKRRDMLFQIGGYSVGQTVQLILPWWSFL